MSKQSLHSYSSSLSDKIRSFSYDFIAKKFEVENLNEKKYIKKKIGVTLL